MRLYVSWADASKYNCWVRRGRELDFLRSCKLSTRQPRYWAGLTPLMALEKSHRRSRCSHCQTRTPSVGRGQRPRDRGTCARALNARLLGRNSRILIGCSSSGSGFCRGCAWPLLDTGTKRPGSLLAREAGGSQWVYGRLFGLETMKEVAVNLESGSESLSAASGAIRLCPLCP